MTTFKDLGLAEPLLRALDKLGYTQPTPIQQGAIPPLLDDRDLLGIAQTGTGKTAGFALPTLDLFISEPRDLPKRGARALVLAPTRELVAQIADSFADYGRFIDDLRIARVTGGVGMGPQVKSLVPGNHVIVATPGRLIDLLDRKDVRLGEVEVLILDEADQMLDMGFIHALKKIIPHLASDRQTLLFSATFPKAIAKLAQQFLSDPVRIEVTPANKTADKVVQELHYVEKGDKPLRLAEHLLRDGVGRSLVFTRTKHGADRLVKKLAGYGIGAVAIHGNKSQNNRRRALDAFKGETVRVLVATDVAARGIDIPGITHVFNYEIPNVAEQYVHRIGRTARADAEGIAVSFVSADEKPYLKDIRKLLGEAVPEGRNPDDLQARLDETEARERIPVVRLTPDQPEARKGRGKSRKRGNKPKGQGKAKDSGRGGQKHGGNAKAAPKGAKPATKGPRRQSGDKPTGSKPSRKRDNRTTRKAPPRR